MLYIELSGNFPLNIIANNLTVLSTDSYSVLVQGRFATKGKLSNLSCFVYSVKRELKPFLEVFTSCSCHNMHFIHTIFKVRRSKNRQAFVQISSLVLRKKLRK